MKSLFLIIILSFPFIAVTPHTVVPYEAITNIEVNRTKNLAFEILDNKCNICHKQQNKKRVFTKENMDGYGNKIYKQVFKWKRMPKGDEITLSPLEYTQLKTWLSQLNLK